MSQDEVDYDSVRLAWERELENNALLDLQDLKLSNMISYLSNVRIELAKTKAEQELKANILTQEVMNLEFMIEDLLLLRKQKILSAVVSDEDLQSDMTLQEEEFYNRLRRAYKGHQNFVDMTIAGKTERKTSPPEEDTRSPEEISPDAEGYVLVRFLEPIEDKFIGLDEAEYGPYRKEDLATIPIANARTWLRDGIVARVVPEDLDSSDKNVQKQSDSPN
ncbi:MAG: hypothetical protein ACOC38_00080 [Promethearchaeia archaeon]